MNSLIPEKRPENSIGETRRKVKEELSGFTEGLRKNSMEAWRVFLKVEEHQVSQELVTDWIKAEEEFYRERATQGLSGKEINPLVSMNYKLWEGYNQALLGTKKDGPVSKTIDFLRSEADDWGKLAEKGESQIRDGGPYSKESYLTEIKTTESNVKAWRKVQKRLIVGAKLFENSPKLILPKT